MTLPMDLFSYMPRHWELLNPLLPSLNSSVRPLPLRTHSQTRFFLKSFSAVSTAETRSYFPVPAAPCAQNTQGNSDPVLLKSDHLVWSLGSKVRHLIGPPYWQRTHFGSTVTPLCRALKVSGSIMVSMVTSQGGTYCVHFWQGLPNPFNTPQMFATTYLWNMQVNCIYRENSDKVCSCSQIYLQPVFFFSRDQGYLLIFSYY